MQKRKRIAFVNQRYGLEVNGGSEYYTRQLAEHLKDRYDIEILTTKAVDYVDWANYYENDVEIINDIVVIRFDVTELRDFPGMDRNWRRMHKVPFGRRFFEEEWIKDCGPQCPGLVEYIRKNKDDYDAIIVVTYLYYPAFYGTLAAPEKTILLPTAHDEPYIHLRSFKREFEAPRALIYLTQEEEEFVENKFNVSGKPHCVAGAGVDLPDQVDADSFRSKYGIEGDYLVYVGRIETSKMCEEMFAMFRQYKLQHPDSELKLVLIGKPVLDLPDDDDIISVGFVSEQDKFNGISGAQALWLPSPFESLSIAVLEAMSLGVPVLVNGDCKVLEGHCVRSGAGWSYGSEEEAIELIEQILTMDSRDDISNNARRYIEQNYQWGDILDRIAALIDAVAN